MEIRYLRYLRTDKLENWHASIAKNTSHCYARGNILVNFTIQNTNSLNLPKHFIVVLAQYNSNKQNIGNNQFYLSNEYELNADINIDATLRYNE